MSLIDAHVTSVRVMGFQKRQKTNVYAIQVRWSDSTAFEIYRRYADFFSFQNSMMQSFPAEAGKVERHKKLIPSLPTVDNVLNIIGRTNSKRVMQSRLRTINNYCQTIVELDSKISHSQLVIEFFRPVPGDKQIQLTRVKKVLSLYPMKTPAGGFEECVLVDDYIPSEKDGGNLVTAKAGEVVKVLQKKESGWWLVRKYNRTGKESICWLPETYLQPYEEESIEDCLGTCAVPNELEKCDIVNDSSDSEASDTPHFSDGDSAIGSEDGTDPLIQSGSMHYVAIADYHTEEANQVNFPKGARIIVIDKDEDGWWFVCYNGREGWAPSSFLELACSTEVEQSIVSADEEQSECSVGGSEEEPPEVFYAAVNYKASKEDEVSFVRGEKIEVLKKSLLGWWTVRLGQGTVGLAPATYLTEEPPPPAHDNKRTRRISITKRVSNMSLPPPRRNDIVEGFGSNDGRERKAAVINRPSISISSADGCGITSPLTPMISSALPEEPTNVTSLNGSPPTMTKCLSASLPQQSNFSQFGERKKEHIPVCNYQSLDAHSGQNIKLSASLNGGSFGSLNPRRNSDGPTMTPCFLTPQPRRKGTSTKLLRKDAIRGFRKTNRSDENDSSGRLRSNSINPQSVATKSDDASTLSYAQYRRNTMPVQSRRVRKSPQSYQSDGFVGNKTDKNTALPKFSAEEAFSNSDGVTELSAQSM